MEAERDDWVAQRAYELWEQAGHPNGQDHDHWVQASAEWEDNRATSSKASWDDEAE
ncbi:DUF2934 domain-containing protein [Neorhizobium alkalisoli]|uniref:DUF2934 family protein n=1 Tax=Neorhizobium alkalisoli TaxID=528178 RepID=A0A561QBT9_9HYPH|nr:DUF2934 domain-containing protein [Neorhizobium alkalisoli]TWF47803.1 DUF2934 family protein [Neorhizobium alkalisoli]